MYGTFLNVISRTAGTLWNVKGNRQSGTLLPEESIFQNIRETRQGAVEITQARKMMVVAFPSVMVEVVRKSLILKGEATEFAE